MAKRGVAAHVITDRFCMARTPGSPEWTTGLTCPVCRAVGQAVKVANDPRGVTVIEQGELRSYLDNAQGWDKS